MSIDRLVADLKLARKVLVWRLVWRIVALAGLIAALVLAFLHWRDGRDELALLFVIVAYLIGIEQRIITLEETP